jgi:hypothetical protein
MSQCQWLVSTRIYKLHPQLTLTLPVHTQQLNIKIIAVTTDILPHTKDQSKLSEQLSRRREISKYNMSAPEQALHIPHEPWLYGPPWANTNPSMDLPDWLRDWVTRGANLQEPMPRGRLTIFPGSTPINVDLMEQHLKAWIVYRLTLGFEDNLSARACELIRIRWFDLRGHPEHKDRHLRPCKQCVANPNRVCRQCRAKISSLTFVWRIATEITLIAVNVPNSNQEEPAGGKFQKAWNITSCYSGNDSSPAATAFPDTPLSFHHNKNERVTSFWV